MGIAARSPVSDYRKRRNVDVVRRGRSNVVVGRRLAIRIVARHFICCRRSIWDFDVRREGVKMSIESGTALALEPVKCEQTAEHAAEPFLALAVVATDRVLPRRH